MHQFSTVWNKRGRRKSMACEIYTLGIYSSFWKLLFQCEAHGMEVSIPFYSVTLTFIILLHVDKHKWGLWQTNMGFGIQSLALNWSDFCKFLFPGITYTMEKLSEELKTLLTKENSKCHVVHLNNVQVN